MDMDMVTSKAVVGNDITNSAEFLSLRLNAELLYIHVSWGIWHEGVSLYDGGYPGHMRDVNVLRGELATKQVPQNSYAEALIINSSNNALKDVLSQVPRRVEAEHQLSTHFYWVAYHEGFRQQILDALTKRDFIEIRKIYSGAQSHNPNARNLLCCVSNYYIESLVNAM